MRYIQFKIVAKDPKGFNWQRFAAGMLLALSMLCFVGAVAAQVAAQTIKQPLFSSQDDTNDKTPTATNAPPSPQPMVGTDSLTPTAGIGDMLFGTPQPPSPPITVTPFQEPYPSPPAPTAVPTQVAMAPTSIPTPLPTNTLPPTPSHTPTATQPAPQPVVTEEAGQEEPLPDATTAVMVTEAIVENTPNTPTHTPIPTLTNTPETGDNTPTDTPIDTPTDTPTDMPTDTPTDMPTDMPTNTPTNTPTSSSPSSPTTFDELTTFGVEINKGYVQRSIDHLAKTNVSWVRYNGIVWHEVEATEGTRDWSTLAQVETDLQLLRERGFEPVVIIRGTPSWAQQVDSSCGPIKEDKLAAFASFMQAVVERYSAAPYNIHYWEMGNEPDVDFLLIEDTMPFGCWGNNNDPYYGGGYFAQMLQTVAPAMRGADPNVRIVLGGLLLDCDPASPPEGKDCKPAKFLEGILQQGGADFFDVIAYHGYAFWELEDKDWDLQHPSWVHRGGAILGKATFLREVMQQYNVSKPLLPNEIGLLCWEGDPVCVQEGYLQDQQNYLVRAYVRVWANDILGTAWYTFNHSGWHDAGLLNPDTTPRPAAYTLEFLSKTLEGATFQEQLSLDSTAQEGYIFRKGTTEYHIYWSNDTLTFTVPIPDNTITVYTFGTDVDRPEAGYAKVDIAGQSNLQVGFAPVMLEIAE